MCIEALPKEHDSTDAASREAERWDFFEQRTSAGGTMQFSPREDFAARSTTKSLQMLRNHILGWPVATEHSYNAILKTDKPIP